MKDVRQKRLHSIYTEFSQIWTKPVTKKTVSGKWEKWGRRSGGTREHFAGDGWVRDLGYRDGFTCIPVSRFIRLHLTTCDYSSAMLLLDII